MFVLRDFSQFVTQFFVLLFCFSQTVQERFYECFVLYIFLGFVKQLSNPPPESGQQHETQRQFLWMIENGNENIVPAGRFIGHSDSSVESPRTTTVRLENRSSKRASKMRTSPWRTPATENKMPRPCERVAAVRTAELRTIKSRRDARHQRWQTIERCFGCPTVDPCTPDSATACRHWDRQTTPARQTAKCRTPAGRDSTRALPP